MKDLFDDKMQSENKMMQRENKMMPAQSNRLPHKGFCHCYEDFCHYESILQRHWLEYGTNPSYKVSHNALLDCVRFMEALIVKMEQGDNNGVMNRISIMLRSLKDDLKGDTRRLVIDIKLKDYLF